MGRVVLGTLLLGSFFSASGEKGCTAEDKAKAEWKQCDSTKDAEAAIHACEAAVAKDPESRSGRKAAARLEKLRAHAAAVPAVSATAPSQPTPPVPRASSAEPPVDAGSAPAAGSDAGAGVTALSERAHMIQRNKKDGRDRVLGHEVMREWTRAEVISHLGVPTWAVIPGDRGEFKIEAEGEALELFWRNGQCAPVAVMFDASMHVIGMDEGRMCDLDGVDINPGPQYACAQPDRRRHCK